MIVTGIALIASMMSPLSGDAQQAGQTAGQKVKPLIGGNASLVVNPESDNVTAPANSSSQSYTFTVSNNGTANTTGTLSIAQCTGAVSSCSVSPTSASISAGSYVTVTVSYHTGATGTGTVMLSASWPGANHAYGTLSVTLPPPPEQVVTVSAPSGPVNDEVNSTITRAFTVHNPNATSETYSWSATCSSVTSCTGQSGSVGVAASSSSSVNVMYSTGSTSGGSGTVSFTAGDAAGNATAALSVVTNDYTPGVVPAKGDGMLTINQPVTDTFTVRNAGNQEAVYTITPNCTGAIPITSCALAISMQHSLDLLPNESAAVPVNWEATGSEPTSLVSLTASFTNAHGTWANTGTRTLTTSTWQPTITPNAPPSGGFAPDATGLIQSFMVTNTGNTSVTYSYPVTCSGTGVFTASCVVVANPGPIAANGGTATVQVRFNSGDAGTTATMTLAVTSGADSVAANANISINQLAPIVTTPTPSSAWYSGSQISNQYFEIHNPNAASGTYSWTTVCHGGVTCTPSPSSGAVAAGDSLRVGVTYNISGAPNATGAIVLTASNSAGSASDSIAVRVMSYTATVTPVRSADTLAAGVSDTARFTVENIGSDSMAYVFTASCDNSAATSCQQPSSTPVPLLPSHQTTVIVPFKAGANFALGGVMLHAYPNGGSLYSDSATMAVVVRSPGALMVSTDFMNEDNQDMSACAASCFAAQYSITTVPFYTLNTARTTSLVYNSDRALPRPFIYADVSPNTGEPTAQKFLLEVRKNGVDLPFTNHEDTLTFVGSSVPVRLAGQVDMTSYSTDVYPVDVIVTAIYGSGGPETVTSHVQLLVVNENKSPIAKGWQIAGPQELYDRDSLAIITDGTGTAEVFRKCGGYCYQSPSGDFSTLSSSDTAAGHHSWTRTYPDGTTLYFGNPTNGVANDWMATDPIGRGVYTGRDGQSRVVEIDNPELQAAQWGSYATNVGYGSNGISWIREPSSQAWQGRQLTFRVGTDSLLYEVSAPDGDSTVFTYDTQQRLSTVRNMNGAVTTYTYDTVTGKVTQITGAAVPTDAGGGSTVLTQPVVAMTPWQSIGVPTGSTASMPATPVSDSAVKATVKDAAGDVTSFTVDRWGQPLVTTDPLGNVTTIKRTGMFATEVDESEGRVSTYVYNGSELIHSTPAGDSVTNYYYGVHSQVDSIDGKGVVAERRGLNSNGTVAWVRQNGNTTLTTRYGYDHVTGQVDTVTDKLGHNTVMRYDPVFGNLMSTTAPDSQVTSATFDRYGRDSTSSQPGLATTTTIYDNMNRPTSASDGVNAAPTTFTYDPFGRFSIVTDPMGQAYRTEYDTLGRTTRRYDATGSGKYNSYRYDIAGRATSTTNRRGQRMDVTYDSLGRMLTRTDVATGAVDRFSYSVDGLTSGSANANEGDTTSVNVNAGTTTTTTWENEVNYLNGQTMNPMFNVADTSTVTAPIFGGPTPSRRIVARDPLLGALGSVSLGGHITTFGYDYHLNARTSTVYVPPRFGASGSTRADSYAPLTGLVTETSFSVPRVDSALHRAYGYDVAGRLTSEQIALQPYYVGGDGALQRQRQFAYDSLGRLTGVTVRRGSCAPWPSDSTVPDSLSSSFGWRYTCGSLQADSGATYSYDAVGNRTDNGAIIAAGNRLIKFNGDTITYDDDGNMTSRYSPTTGASRQYAWNTLGQLDSTIVMSAPDPQTGVQSKMVERYFYDANGRLVHLQHVSVVNGALVYSDSSQNWVVYQGGQVSELVQSPDFYTDVAYDDGTDRPAMQYIHVTGGDMWYDEVVDPMGNVAGTVLDDTIGVGYVYDPWGANTATSGGNLEVLGWKGLQTETRAGLIYMRARWYDPALGRFLSEDPAGLAGGLNQYAFAGDDPINASDPSGYIPDDGSDCQAALDALYLAGVISGNEDIHGCPGLPTVNVWSNPNNWIDPSEPPDVPSYQGFPTNLLVASRDATSVTPGPKGHPGLCLLSAGELGIAGGEDLTIGPEILAAEGIGAAASTFFVDGVLHISVEDVPLVEGGAALNHVATISHSAARTGTHWAGTVTEGNISSHAHGDSYLTVSTALSFIPFANLFPTGKIFVHDCF